MGICRCRKRTDLFCFVHKKHVCTSCICEQHEDCVVKTYLEWLQDSDYAFPPKCLVCQKDIQANDALRLSCLELAHPSCIDTLALSLPANTAQAGYTCPSCSKPLVPPPSDLSPLAETVRSHIRKSAWADRVYPSLKAAEQFQALEQQKQSAATAAATAAAAPATSGYSDTDTVVIPMSSSAAMTSRKGARAAPVELADEDEDEDKYRPRSFLQFLAVLGLMTTPSPGSKSSKPVLNVQRIIVLCLLIAVVVAAVNYYLSAAVGETFDDGDIAEEPDDDADLNAGEAADD
mmetsp:Transcript_4972/g.12369  ORF Transcript_4972/g.12369 Transcript_4972/m.12369 type:complete len:290 (-) Transcript_4972:126-995(-)